MNPLTGIPLGMGSLTGSLGTLPRPWVGGEERRCSGVDLRCDAWWGGSNFSKKETASHEMCRYQRVLGSPIAAGAVTQANMDRCSRFVG